MSNDVRIIDSLDKPNAVAPMNAAPLSIQHERRGREDWRAILARGLVTVVGGSVAYAFFGHDVREWLTYGGGAYLANAVPYVAGTVGAAWAAKRFVLMDKVGGVPVWTFLNRVTTEQIVDYTGKATVAAATAELPRGLQVYNPSNQVTVKQEPAPTITTIDQPVLPTPPLLAHAERLTDLVSRGYVRGSDYSLMVGYGDDQPGNVVSWDWSVDGGAGQAVIAAVAGSPGSGKTYTMANIVGLAMHKRVQVMLCDPQAESTSVQSLGNMCEPLRHAFMREVAVEETDILKAIAAVYKIGEARALGRDSNMQPVLLVIDEFSGLMIGNPHADKMIELLIKIGSQFRKFNIRVLIGGTSWKANIVGGELGTTLRNLIRFKVLHANTPVEAAFLTYGMPREELKQLDNLSTGWALAYGPSLMKRVHVPALQPDLMRDVAATLVRQPAVVAPAALTAEQPAMDDLLSSLLAATPAAANSVSDTQLAEWRAAGLTRDQARAVAQSMGLGFKNERW